MPKLKLSGRKLCTTGRKLAVCGCGDPCCATIAGSTTYVPLVSGNRVLRENYSLNATQTTTGWSDLDFPSPIAPPYSATGQVSATNAVSGSSPNASCQTGATIISGYIFDGATQQWVAQNGYETGTVSTPTANIEIVGGSLWQQLDFAVRPSNETPGTSVGVYNTTGYTIASNDGFQPALTVIQWYAQTHLYSQLRLGGNKITTYASVWKIIVKISSNGKRLVYVYGAPSFRIPPSFITTNSLTVTPTLANGNPVGFTFTGDFRGVSPAFGTTPAQTDTLNLTANVQTNVLPCGAGIAASSAALDDALFS